MVAALLLVAGPARGLDAETRYAVEVEGGAVWQGRNDVEIPNDGTATRFSLVDLAGNGPWPTARVYFTWDLTQRHGLRFLAAPLSYTESGTSDVPISFAGEVFAPGTLDATYRFNSWRAGYRYRFSRSDRWRWWVGFTAKVRDAKVELRQDGLSAKKTDVGFVPLLHVSGELRIVRSWRVLLDVEGLAGGPGRAVDASLEVGYSSGEWMITGGYRTVEGGADVDEVYNFAWFHSLVVSGIYRWGKLPAG